MNSSNSSFEERRDADLMPPVREVPVTTDGDEKTLEIVEARAQIEETRSHLSETIEAIKEQLSPSTLIAEAKESAKAATVEAAHELKEATVDKAQEIVGSVVDKAKEMAATASDVLHNAADFVVEKTTPMMESARQQLTPAMDTARNVADNTRSMAITAKGAGETIVDTIKANPIPVALIALGIGWLLAGPRRPMNNGSMIDRDDSSRRYRESESGANNDLLSNPSIYRESNGLQSAVSNTGETVHHLASGAREKVSDVKDKLSDVASNVKQQASDLAVNAKTQAGTIADTAKNTTQQTVSFLDQWVHDEPIAAGAIALLVGAAVGLALPGTEPENQWFGAKRDELAQKASETAQDLVGKAQDAAQTALGSAREKINTASSNNNAPTAISYATVA